MSAPGRDHNLRLRDVEAFLFHEARLLDERRFDGWLDLFTADATYWLPLERGQTSPHEVASILYDDRMSLEMRVRQLMNPGHHAQVPPTWTSHLIGNVVLENGAAGEGTLRVRSRFQVVEARGERQRLLAGQATHDLVAAGDGFRIRAKRVDLVNCDATHDGFTVPI